MDDVIHCLELHFLQRIADAGGREGGGEEERDETKWWERRCRKVPCNFRIDHIRAVFL